MNLTDFPVASGLSTIKAHRVTPGVFGRYYDLVFALQDKRHEDANRLFQESSRSRRRSRALLHCPLLNKN